MYGVSKKYGHERGLSCVFRQWRADSHCNQLHGYSISVEYKLEAETLDARNWVFDFGGFKPIKQWLEDHFDHKLLVAADDPRLDDITMLQQLGIADVVVVDRIGCESFAKMAWDAFHRIIDLPPAVRLVEVEVREHESNGAYYRG